MEIQTWHILAAIAILGSLLAFAASLVWIFILNPLFKLFDWFTDRWRGHGG